MGAGDGVGEQRVEQFFRSNGWTYGITELNGWRRMWVRMCAKDGSWYESGCRTK